VKWNAFVTTTTRGGRTVATFALALLLSAIAFADTFAGLSLRVLNDSAPAGGSIQLKLSVTEPKPIIISQANFDYGAALGPVQGVLMPSDPASAGAAVVQGHSLRIRTVSPGGTLGLSTTAPAVVVTIAVPAGLAPGTAAPLNLNPLTSFFDDASGKPYPLQVKQGTFHVQGTVSITDVLPGGGFLPAGSTVTLVGLGFQPGATVEIDGVAVASSAFVDANHVQAVTAADAQLDGRRVRVTNPDRTRASYLSYLRAASLGESARPLLAATEPVFPVQPLSSAFVSTPSPAPGTFFALALQNPGPTDSNVSIELWSSGSVVASTSLAMPARTEIAREASELFTGVSAPAGSFLRVTASSPVQVLGLSGDEGEGTVTPLLPGLTSP